MRFRAYLSGFLFLACVAAAGFRFVTPLNRAKHSNDQNRSESREIQQYKYKEYHNERFNFSFEYPQGWEINEAVDGGGVTVGPKLGPYLQYSPTIGVRVAEVGVRQDGTPRTLEEDYETSLGSLKKYRLDETHHVSNVKVVKKESTTFQGLPAIFRKVTFNVDGQSWVDEGIMLHGKDEHYSFGVALICSSQQLPSFQPVYDEAVRTFQFLEPLK
jgi:hypothetical protein